MGSCPVLYRVLKYLLLGPLLRLVFRPRIEGLDHVPEEGAAIIMRQSSVVRGSLCDAG